jgi:hypothetical protein
VTTEIEALRNVEDAEAAAGVVSVAFAHLILLKQDLRPNPALSPLPEHYVTHNHHL